MVLELEHSLRVFQKSFAREFKNRFWHAQAEFPSSILTKGVFNTLGKFVLRDGKRLRPFLFFAASKVRSQGFWDFAIGMELVHTAMLIHDDIIDRSRKRRGKPSMHRMIGIPEAIVAGDIAWSLGLYSMATARLPAARRASALREFLIASVRAGEGEMLDVEYRAKNKISHYKLCTMYELKTAHYSFMAPLVAGAILRGENHIIPSLRSIAGDLGILYQLADDIADMRRDRNSILKKLFVRPARAKESLYKTISQKIESNNLPSKLKIVLQECADFFHA